MVFVVLNEDRKGRRFLFYSVVIGKETIYGDLNHWVLLYTRQRIAGVLHLVLLR